MKKLLKAFLALVMGFSLAACGGEKYDPATTFIYANGGEADYLDAAHGSDSVSAYITNQTNMFIVRLDEQGQVVYEAAKDIVRSTNADGLPVLTITLKDGLKWSNGDDLTAEHFVYGMKHSLCLGTEDAYYSYFISNYVLNAAKYWGVDTVAEMTDLGIKALDAKTIEITLAAPCDYFEQLLAAGVFCPAHPTYVKDKDYTWADDATVPTSGAFKYKKIDRASEVVMVKNENYFDAAKVKMETLICKTMTDMDAQAMAYKTDEIDWATSVNTSVATEYAGKDDLLISTSIINYFVAINSFVESAGNTPIKDVNVRRALQLGIDRSAFVTAFNAPGVYTELKGFVPTGFPDGDGDFRSKGGDLVYTDKAKAKQLMEAAGYTASNPLKLTYYYNESATHSTAAEVLKQQLKDINVELTLKTAEVRTFFNDRSLAAFEIARHAMSADYLDVTTYLDMPILANQEEGKEWWGDATYDKLMAEAAKLTGDARIAKLHEAEKYLVETQAYCIPLFEYKAVSLRDAKITGWSTNAQANFDFRFVDKHVAE